jgi:2-hydroxychromene-2-carboxylate isomerase
MTKQVEFFFDVGSPASYLAWTQLPAMCKKSGAELIYKPMLLGGLFQATGNASPAAVPAKAKHSAVDMGRFAKRYGVTLIQNPHFPIITLMLMRAAVGVQLKMPERFQDYLGTVFEAIWIESVNLNEPARVAAALAKRSFDPEKVVALAADSEVKRALRANTDEALAKGAFGAPTMFVGEEMFFGQDRLEWVRDALT